MNDTFNTAAHWQTDQVALARALDQLVRQELDRTLSADTMVAMLDGGIAGLASLANASSVAEGRLLEKVIALIAESNPNLSVFPQVRLPVREDALELVEKNPEALYRGLTLDANARTRKSYIADLIILNQTTRLAHVVDIKRSLGSYEAARIVELKQRMLAGALVAPDLLWKDHQRMFGGVFEVLERRDDGYRVRLTAEGEGFIGRLKIGSPYRERSTRVKLEQHYASFVVQEILREPYSGRSFPGFENIDLSFAELEALVRSARPDWKAALASVKGIYLISDVKTGKRYVGSAYGDHGVWSRWVGYVASGHGGNVELKNLVSDPTLEYCRQAFRFSLLEHRPVMTPDVTIIERESFWKRILLTRGEHGLNRN